MTDRRSVLRGALGGLTAGLYGSAAAGCARVFGPRSRPPVQLRSEYTLTRVDGRSLPIGAYRGRVVWLDVWATWCRPCEASIPFYAELQAEYRSDGFSVVSVSVDENELDLQDFLRRTTVSFSVFHDPQAAIAKHMRLTTVPTAFLLDRDGRTVWVHVGFVSADEMEIRRQILRILRGPDSVGARRDPLSPSFAHGFD